MEFANQSGPQLPLPPAILPQVAPSTYLLSHLLSSSPIRPSGRPPSQTRHVSLHTGSLTNTNGSALVRLGNTTVLCGVRAEVLDIRNIANYRPALTLGRKDGRTTVSNSGNNSELTRYSLLIPNIELQTGASPLPSFQPSSGAPSALAQSLTQRLLSTVHAIGLVHVDDLGIYSSDPVTTVGSTEPELDQAALHDHHSLKGYWTLYIDIVVLSHDGSIFDAAFMALSAALRNTSLPKAWFDADRDQIVCSPRTEDFRTLRLGGESPVSLSWRVFEDKEERTTPPKQRKWVLFDPDALEEESGACTEMGTILVDHSSIRHTANGHGEELNALQILKVEKSGGGILPRSEMENIARVAEDRWEEWNRILKDSAIG